MGQPSETALRNVSACKKSLTAPSGGLLMLLAEIGGPENSWLVEPCNHLRFVPWLF